MYLRRKVYIRRALYLFGVKTLFRFVYFYQDRGVSDMAPLPKSRDLSATLPKKSMVFDWSKGDGCLEGIHSLWGPWPAVEMVQRCGLVMVQSTGALTAEFALEHIY